MRVVQLRRGRIVKFAAIGVFTLALLLLLINQFAPANFGRIGTDPLASALVGAKDGNLQQSYPDDLPVFRGKGSYGNYEPSNSEKVTQFPTAITYILKIRSQIDLFVQVFCTSLNGNTYRTKYQLSRDKSAGLVKLAN